MPTLRSQKIQALQYAKERIEAGEGYICLLVARAVRMYELDPRVCVELEEQITDALVHEENGRLCRSYTLEIWLKYSSPNCYWDHEHVALARMAWCDKMIDEMEQEE